MIRLRSRDREDDIVALYRIERTCFAYPWTLYTFRKKLSQYDTWVKYDKDKPVGMVMVEKTPDGGNVVDVAVLASHRGKGIATHLLRAAERRYKRKKRVVFTLETNVGNPAQTLYFHLGYRVFQYKKNRYGTGEHAIYMRKEL